MQWFPISYDILLHLSGYYRMNLPQRHSNLIKEKDQNPKSPILMKRLIHLLKRRIKLLMSWKPLKGKLMNFQNCQELVLTTKLIQGRRNKQKRLSQFHLGRLSKKGRMYLIYHIQIVKTQNIYRMSIERKHGQMKVCNYIR